MIKRVHASVQGNVQGVGFRYYASHIAGETGVVGNVRNTADGRVEAYAEGDETALQSFVQAFTQGPHSATVTSFDLNWTEPTGEYKAFSVV